MTIDERNIKMWSTIGSRATFGIAALELAKKINNLIVCTCDVSTSRIYETKGLYGWNW